MGRSGPQDDGLEGVEQQRLVVEPSFGGGQGDVLPLSPKAEWTVAVTDLNNPSRPPTGFRIFLEHPRAIDTVVRGPMEKAARGVKAFRLTIRFQSTELQRNHFRFENLKVSVKYRLTDGKGVVFEPDEPLDLYSIVPDFIALVSGYSFEAEQGRFPARLAQVIAPWLRAHGCPSVTLAALNRDLEGAAAPDLAPFGVWENLNRRRRSAGIVRQTVNMALHDRTLEPGEFGELLKALNAYRDACAADPPRL